MVQIWMAGMDKGGLSSYFIIDDDNSYASLARIFHEIYILESFLNKTKRWNQIKCTDDFLSLPGKGLVLTGGYLYDLEPYHDFVVEIVYFLNK